MGMNENEVIEELQAMRDLAEFNISQGNARGTVYIPKDRLLVLDAAIKALNEIQQYRAIGTVRDCQTAMKFYKDNSCELRSYRAIGTPEEMYISHRNLKIYEEIGTVEECRAAVEKQRMRAES